MTGLPVHASPRPRPTRVRIVALALALCWGVCAAPASARENPAAAIVRSARTLANEGRLLEAANLYLEAYELHPVPVLLFNAARMYQRAGRPIEARDAYRRYLAIEKDTDGLAEARARLAETLDAIPGRLLLEVSPPGAEVTVDGEAVATGGVLTLSRGVHLVKMSRKGYYILERTVTIEPDALTRVELALTPLPSKADPLPTVLLKPKPARHGSVSAWSWVAMGLGAASIGCGAAMTVLAASDRARVTGAARNGSGLVVGVSRSTALALERSADRKGWASLGLYAGGGALVFTGVVTAIVSGTRHVAAGDAATGFAIAPATDGTLLVVSGRF
jgi:hypothetical protein